MPCNRPTTETNFAAGTGFIPGAPADFDAVPLFSGILCGFCGIWAAAMSCENETMSCENETMSCENATMCRENFVDAAQN